MKITVAIVAFVIISCAAAHPLKTWDTMLAYRLSHSACERTCPVGSPIAPVEPQYDHVFEDCCVDPLGFGWSSGAWNAGGQFMTEPQLLARPLRSFGCGGAGLPDCEAP